MILICRLKEGTAVEINRLSDELKRRFGEKVYKISLTSGCTCPNRDGTLSDRGCLFCSQQGSGEFSPPPLSISEQIVTARKRIADKTSARKFIGYFQSYTNTYGDQERLLSMFRETVSYPEICALSVGTRPDCLEDGMVKGLSEINLIKPVWVELGLQTTNEDTAERMNRCYSLDVFRDAYRRLKAAGLEVIVHVILGLPGETEDDMLETARYLASLDPVLDGIKIHMLQILKGTELADIYETDPFHVLSLEEYTDLVIKVLKTLDPKTVIHRFTGDGPKRILIEPQWCWDKKKVLNYMNSRIEEA